MMNICLLGCGGSLPTPHRFLTSLFIEVRGKKILVDCGEGTQVSMKMVGWGFKDIEGIFFTHAHADHILGLPGLLLTIANSGRTEPITLMGPKGIKEVIVSLMILCSYLPYQVEIYECSNNEVYSLPFNKQLIISTLDVDHTTPTIAYSFYLKRNRKFERETAIKNNVPISIWNKLQKGEQVYCENKLYSPEMVLGQQRAGIKLSYCTDSRPVDELINFVKNSDLFVCEGMYGSDEYKDKAIKNKHMTFSEAAKLAKQGMVNELLLTHFSPSMISPVEYIQNAESIFPSTVIGEDRLIKSLKFN